MKMKQDKGRVNGVVLGPFLLRPAKPSAPIVSLVNINLHLLAQSAWSVPKADISDIPADTFVVVIRVMQPL